MSRLRLGLSVSPLIRERSFGLLGNGLGGNYSGILRFRLKDWKYLDELGNYDARCAIVAFSHQPELFYYQQLVVTFRLLYNHSRWSFNWFNAIRVHFWTVIFFWVCGRDDERRRLDPPLISVLLLVSFLFLVSFQRSGMESRLSALLCLPWGELCPVIHFCVYDESLLSPLISPSVILNPPHSVMENARQRFVRPILPNVWFLRFERNR